MQKKLLLVDGHSILNRAFYGIPQLTNAEGIPTNAVYGFLNILLRILKEEDPQYLIVAFDVHAPTFRHRKYDAYKGTRRPMPEELRTQVPLIKEVLSAMHIRIVEKEGYEADDVIGTLSRKAAEEGMSVVILSGDRDLLQLADSRVMVRIPKTKKGTTVVENYLPEDVKETYGIEPREIIDLKALMGDSADNIPGIPGVGVKTATKIIQQYHSIENASEHLSEIKPKKAMESLRDHFDLAVMSKDLAEIRLDAPVGFDPEDCRLGTLFTDEAYPLFKRLNFRNLLSRFGENEREQKLPEIPALRDYAALDEVIQRASKGEKPFGLAMAAEEGEIRALALAFSKTEVYYIPQDGFATHRYFRMALTEKLLRAPSVCVYDLKEILRYAPVPERKGITDLTIAAYLLDPLRSEYPYDVVCAEYAGLTLPSGKEIFRTKKIPAFADMQEKDAAKYFGYQALSALLSAEPVLDRLREQDMDSLFLDVEMPLVFTLSEMEKAGMRVEPETLGAYGTELQGQIEVLENRIYEEAGEHFNINSPKQLGVVLFEKMKLPGGKKTRTGYSTAADVLEKLAPFAPVVKDVLEYRQLTKLKSTYADALPGYIGADGRIHSHFNQTITATGRISSNEPNLQNIPVRMELGRQIRKVFVPEEGRVFIDADYSQIELRVLAALSGDERLIEAYRSAQDIHRLTASQVFHVPFDEVTDQQRRNAKAVNFGIVYGISSFGLSQDLSITRKEAEQYIQHYFETYPSIKSYLDGLVASAKEKGYAATLYGRRRPVPELKSSNFMQRSFGERVAMNSPIQGTAADIIKIAMNRVRRRLQREHMETKLVLQVHDELILEAPEAEKEAAKRLLEEEMCGAAQLPVALTADVHTGYSWYDVK